MSFSPRLVHAGRTPTGRSGTRSPWRAIGAIMLAFATGPLFGAPATPAPRNLFSELLGKSDAEITAKIDAGFRQLFYGDDAEERIYFPVGTDEAYIADINDQDVRSEGISYGMMIAVQLNHRPEFDRLYRWAKHYMYHAEGPRRGYFAWQCRLNGEKIDPGSAPDGEEWLATALLLAADRWGKPKTSHDIDYDAEAQALLHEMLHKPTTDIVRSIFDRDEKLVVFAPTSDGGVFTDPSYHLPAFYELWARSAASADDRTFWAEAAQTSRAFLHRAAHPKTGLMPDYTYFDGRPYRGHGPEHGDFRYDAWRIMANVAIDYANYAADPWQREQSNRIIRFLASYGDNIPNQFAIDGKPLTTDTSSGMVALIAVAGLAADPDVARPFVDKLWKTWIPRGRYRYYDGLLYQLALLEVSGNFRIKR
jgi:oligosaccharide reducing-end xylanase